MRFTLLLTLVALATAIPATSQKKRYDGYALWQVKVVTDQQADAIVKYRDTEDHGLDFWSEPSTSSLMDVLVSAEAAIAFKDFLEEHGLTSVKVLTKDIQKMVDVESNLMSKLRMKSADLKSTVLENYARYGEVNQFIEELALQNPSIASVQTLGKTYEGRDQKMLKISTGGNKEAIFLDAAIHAREWIVVPVACNIANWLVTGYGTDREITRLINAFDWYIVPIINADGYEYTHTNERFWRKTRTRSATSICRGADPNRNWDSNFGGVGTSGNPCSDTYHGVFPFSEPCTESVRAFIAQNRASIRSYVSLHSYSQLWMTPYGYTFTRPGDAAEMDRVANIAAAALKAVDGETYRVGTPGQLIYRASGGSFDWAKEKAGIEYSYTLELRPKGGGLAGFVLPPEQIPATSQEVWAGVKAMANEILKKL